MRTRRSCAWASACRSWRCSAPRARLLDRDLVRSRSVVRGARSTRRIRRAARGPERSCRDRRRSSLPCSRRPRHRAEPRARATIGSTLPRRASTTVAGLDRHRSVAARRLRGQPDRAVDRQGGTARRGSRGKGGGDSGALQRGRARGPDEMRQRFRRAAPHLGPLEALRLAARPGLAMLRAPPRRAPGSARYWSAVVRDYAQRIRSCFPAPALRSAQIQGTAPPSSSPAAPPRLPRAGGGGGARAIRRGIFSGPPRNTPETLHAPDRHRRD
jgi:hypothetical protein